MHKQHFPIWLPAVGIPLSLAFALLFLLAGGALDSQVSAAENLQVVQPAANPLMQDTGLSMPALVTSTIHFPLVVQNIPWTSAFGAELNDDLTGTLLNRASDLGMSWVRLHRISWREIQPVEGGPYNWSVLASFENELRAARQAGITPVVIVHHSPRWATINDPFPTDCGAIRPDKYGAFAAFMQALVNRYKAPQFNVHYWELGNEPDVDPTLVAPDQVYGCWGDTADPYYGGREYGKMLTVVTPAIKAADPQAKVLVGGLLLAHPETTNPAEGKPERFLNGILEAGGGPYFDVLPYHAYPSYNGREIDYDNGQNIDWTALGGWSVGKARYLRQIMAQYGVSKPLFLNETALGCNADWFNCDPPPAAFFEAQANYVPRTFVRALGEDIKAFVWYTLDGPGWRQGGLLDASDSPRPSYFAYQNLIRRLRGTHFVSAVDYGPAIEAYRFEGGSLVVHVAWSIDTTPDTFTVPQSTFLAAYDRNGNVLTPTPAGGSYQFSVGFSPIYVELKKAP